MLTEPLFHVTHFESLRSLLKKNPHPDPHHLVVHHHHQGNPMIQATMAQPGDPARNFSLKDQNDKTFDLYEQTGKRVLLSFHPLAWTEFCAAQMTNLEKNLGTFASLNCVPVGISVDSRRPARGHGQSRLGLPRLRFCVTSGRTGPLP
jgi:hypothetical protein